MKRRIAYIVISVLSFPLSNFSLTEELKEENYMRAENLWEKRSDVKSACNSHILYLITFKKDRSDGTIFEKTLRSCYWCALLMKYENFEEIKRKKTLKQCKSLIDENYEAYKGNVFIHFWNAVITGMLAEIEGFSLNSLRYTSTLKGEIKIALDMDAKYYYGGPYRMWGKTLISLPKFLLLLSGEKEEDGLEFLKKAVMSNDRYLFNLLYFADGLIKLNKKEEAKKILQKIIEVSPSIFPEEIEENKVAQKQAEKRIFLLEK